MRRGGKRRTQRKELPDCEEGFFLTLPDLTEKVEKQEKFCTCHFFPPTGEEEGVGTSPSTSLAEKKAVTAQSIPLLSSLPAVIWKTSLERVFKLTSVPPSLPDFFLCLCRLLPCLPLSSTLRDGRGFRIIFYKGVLLLGGFSSQSHRTPDCFFQEMWP